MKFNKRAQASLQILLLIGMAFAVSFIIYSADKVEAAGTLSQPSLCCEKTLGGDFCINTNGSKCDTTFKTSPTSCETASYCRLGTCYDSSEGICMENTPQKVCEQSGGTWDERKMEEVPQCQLGCCIVADQAALVPLVRCKKLSSFYGVSNNYLKEITDEIECIAKAQSQDMGACVYESDFERICEFTTREDCKAPEVVETLQNETNVSIEISSDKKFYKDYLCSAEELNTVCARQASTGCYEGKVYYYDSCGNRENVYSSNKDLSWNKGRVAEPQGVCGANDGSDKECGNCDYLLGTRCAEWTGILGLGKPTDSDYFCKKTICEDRWGNERKNGESWCVYDGGTGDGKDAVGSRHYKEVCVDGEVKVEPCADFRNEFCIEGSTKTEDGEFSNAACRVNRWQECASITSQSDCENLDVRDCAWVPAVSGLNMASSGESAGGKTFSNPTTSGTTFSNPIAKGETTTAGVTGNAIFGGGDDKDDEEQETVSNRQSGVCVPDIPPGLKFWDNGEAKSICSQASAKCIVKYEESTFGGKKCIENCECLEEDWGRAANGICTSLGDCGGYINYIEEYTEDGYQWFVDGTEKTFTPNQVNQIKLEANSPGKSKSMAYAVPIGLAGIGLVAAMAGKSITGTLAPSFIPNLATPAFGAIDSFAKMGTGLGGAGAATGAGATTTLSSLTGNWLAASAFNALLIGGIVWGGAKLLGADSNKAGALGAATMAGLMAGSLAGQGAQALWATKSLTALPTGVANPIGGGVGSSFELLEGWKAVDGSSLASIGDKIAGPNGLTAVVGEGGTLNGIVGPGLSTTHIALINLGVTIGVAVLVYFLLKKDYSEEMVEFKCLAWQAPKGGADCEKCNTDDLACSDYRCRSLGQSCELVNAGTEQEKCVNVNPYDVDPPVISPNDNDLTAGYEYTDVKNSPPGPGFRIVSENESGCLKAFTPLEFGISTDEPAQCKIDFNHTTSFEDMSYWMGGSNLYLYNHTEQFSLPGSDAVKDSIILENGKDWTFFIRCQDKAGNENSAEYAVRFCTEEGPDNTAPQIKATSVLNGGCVAANTDKANVEFYVNEPADCRWSFDDQSYDNMQNQMACSSQLYQLNSLQLYTCKADLTGVARDETTYYVRCKDQPDAEENDRNENRQSYEFSLKGSTDLKIKNLQPNKTIFGAVNPAPVELYVETLFGCDNGKAICYYSTTGKDGDYVMFYDTNKEDGVSTQRQDLAAGSHTYYYKCVDSGGNVAINSTSFNLDIDTSAPMVARVYEEDQMLKIITVRDSECSYSFDDCDFSFSEGTEMPYANSTTHVTEWKQDKTYYIKCRDEFRNEDADCSVIVKPTRNFL